MSENFHHLSVVSSNIHHTNKISFESTAIHIPLQNLMIVSRMECIIYFSAELNSELWHTAVSTLFNSKTN